MGARSRHQARALLIVIALVGACDSSSPAPKPLVPTANPAREVLDTALALDVTAHTGVATLMLGSSVDEGATLEVGDLTIDAVTDADQADVPFATHDAKLDLALAGGDAAGPLAIAYHYNLHEGFQGISKNGFSLVWPYFCGNMFPCHSDPSDGTTFSSVAIAGVPSGDVAIAPPSIPADAPSYQVAFALGAYTELPVGTTTAGTQISMWYRANEMTNAQKGSAHLVAAIDWFEKTLGPYRFGPKMGSVPVSWGIGQFGGMEHHPFWHVATGALADEETNVHESAHGWFGDGIRIACWEDFVLSEGTVSYLAGRALDVVAPSVGATVWQGYATSLAQIAPTDPVWPDSCGAVDILKDNLFTNAPYMRGAFFYRAVALKVGADVLDGALHQFYVDHAGRAAKMNDMLDTIKTVTGYDPTACAQMWLRSTTTIPVVGACP